MMKHAEDDETFKNTVNYYLCERLADHTLEEVEMIGLSSRTEDKLHGVFRQCMGEGDISEVTTQIVESDDSGDGWDEFMEGCRKRANDAIDAEIPRQLLILRSDREPTANDLGAGRI